MAKVRVFSGIYEKGEMREFEHGTHLNVPSRCIEIPENHRVRGFEKADRGGASTKWLYGPLKIMDISFHGVYDPNCIEIEETNTPPDQMLIGKWYKDTGAGTKYPATVNIPVGNYYADSEPASAPFPNNQLEELIIPPFSVVRLYDNENDKTYLEYQADDKPIKVDLSVNGYADKISRIDYFQDEWFAEAAELLFDDAVLEEYETVGQEILGTNKDPNPNGESLTVGGQIDVSITESYEFRWNLNWNISVSTSVKVFGSGVDIGLSLGGDIGGTKSKSKTRTITQTASRSAKPGETVKLQLAAKQVKGEVPTRFTFVNKRTGERRMELGVTPLDMATRTEVYAEVVGKIPEPKTVAA